jgi:hypothetical protein
MSRLNSPATASSPHPFSADKFGDCPSSIPRRLQVLILYRDLLTARTVMDRLARMLRAYEPSRRTVLHPLLWRLDQLEDARWRQPSLADAARTDWIVFAGRAVTAFSPATNRWLKAALARKNGQPLNLLALSPDDDPWSITLEQPPVIAQTELMAEAAEVAIVEPLEALAKSA